MYDIALLYGQTRYVNFCSFTPNLGGQLSISWAFAPFIFRYKWTGMTLILYCPSYPSKGFYCLATLCLRHSYMLLLIDL